MTDLEITKFCAEAMGYDAYEWQTSGVVTGSNLPILLPTGRKISYDPLHDDAQAMALVKMFNLCILPAKVTVVVGQYSEARNLDLNRAICECVAKMQAKK